ncbi:MAG: hypothetical protein NC079_11020 [Clostridium sp.]|nr:hypothetical protein [Acetatifactor muris]MCM1527929.1 hypothetical protein [Bacteroides sp.]MCM1564122.1 hypothetical protein [Clostridium sp.]
MKKSMALLFSVILLVTLCACGDSVESPDPESLPWELGGESTAVLNEDIAVSVNRGTLTTTRATLSIKNNWDQMIRFGANFEIEIMIDGKWYDIEEGGGLPGGTLPNASRFGC